MDGLPLTGDPKVRRLLGLLYGVARARPRFCFLTGLESCSELEREDGLVSTSPKTRRVGEEAGAWAVFFSGEGSDWVCREGRDGPGV